MRWEMTTGGQQMRIRKVAAACVKLACSPNISLDALGKTIYIFIIY